MQTMQTRKISILEAKRGRRERAEKCQTRSFALSLSLPLSKDEPSVALHVFVGEPDYARANLAVLHPSSRIPVYCSYFFETIAIFLFSLFIPHCQEMHLLIYKYNWSLHKLTKGRCKKLIDSSLNLT